MSECSVLYATVCIGVFLLETIINIGAKGSIAVDPLIPFLCGLIALLGYRLFLKKERKGSSVFLISLSFFAMELAAEILLCRVSGFGSWCIVLGMNIYLLVTAFQILTKPDLYETLLGRFEWSLILLFFLLLLERTVPLEHLRPIHLILSALFCGISLIRNRVLSQNTADRSAAGTLRVTAVSSLLLAGAAGLAVLTARPFGKLLVSLLTFLRSLFFTVFHLFERFLLWLASFASGSEGDTGFLEAVEGISMSGPVDQPMTNNAALFYAFGALVCIAMLVVLVLGLRHLRFREFRSASGRRGSPVKRESLLQILLHRLRDGIEGVRYRVFLSLHRSSVLGVYLNLEHTLKHTSLARAEGETPMHFLNRCADTAARSGEQDAVTALRHLISSVNDCLYGRSDPAPEFPEAKTIRGWSARVKVRLSAPGANHSPEKTA